MKLVNLQSPIHIPIIPIPIPTPIKCPKAQEEVNVNQKKKLKEIESNLNSEANLNEYTKCKKDLELTYQRIAEGVKIRSKCPWYEEGEKSTKFFLNLEKTIC